MQTGSTDMAVVVAVKDAEISMLRQQLAQLSGDMNRNLTVLSARETEASEARDAANSLTVLLSEKDALFSQYEEQVAALEALRQKEAAEVRTLKAALESQRADWQQQMTAEQRRREALEQQLKEAEEASTAQLQSAQQAAVTQAVQHSNHYQVELERAAGQRKQLQALVQELQAALAGKESELGAVQMQLAAALESSKRVQESHGKSVAAKNGLVAQMQQELEQVKAGHTQANKTHEAHIAQLISSINELQDLCSDQAAELQRHADGAKALQEELRTLAKASKQHEQAQSKAEMRRSAMESALQHEVTSRAAVTAQHNTLQECVVSVLTDLQQQYAGASAAVMQLSAQLSEAQEQMVCAAVGSPRKAAPAAHALEEQCQELSAQLSSAQEQAACLAAVCTQLDRKVTPLLPPGSVASRNQWAAAPESVTATPQQATASPRVQRCMAALAQSLQQQQQQQLIQQQRYQQEPPVAAAQQYSCCSPSGPCTQPLQAFEPLYPPHQSSEAGDSCCQGHASFTPADTLGNWGSAQPWSQQGFSAAPGAPAACAHQPSWATPVKHAHCCDHQAQAASPSACQHSPQPHTCRQQPHALSRSPGPAAVAGPKPQPRSAAGLVSQLQAGVTRLQQQLGASQPQLMQQGNHAGVDSPQRSRCRSEDPSAHWTSTWQASTPATNAGPCPIAHAQQQHQHHPQLQPQHQHEYVTYQQHRQSPRHGGQQQAVQRAHHRLHAQQCHEALQAAAAEAGACSHDGDCSSEDAQSTLSCSADVTAAVVAARRRLGQKASCPVRQPQPHSKAAALVAAAAGGAGRSSRRSGAAAAIRGNQSSHAADLAALASATLKKLELLSNDVDCDGHW